MSPARRDPPASRSASPDAEGDSAPPASSREVVAGHQPPAPRAAEEIGPSVVVNEGGHARYDVYADATVVTRRRTQSLPDGPMPDVGGKSARKRWTTYVVWGVVGAAAFLLGGALSQMRKSGGTGTVVEAATATAAAAKPPDPAKPAEVVAAEPTTPEQFDEQGLDPAALDKLPAEVKPKVAAPKLGASNAPSHAAAAAKPGVGPKPVSAPTPTAPAPVKDIPSEI